MRVYVAGPWARKDEVEAFAKQIGAAGHVITSRWFRHGEGGSSTGCDKPDDEIRHQALEDYEDVISADFLVVFNLQMSEGKAVETGIALANNIPFITVGPRGNIFALLGEAELDTIEGAIEYLKRYEAEIGE